MIRVLAPCIQLSLSLILELNDSLAALYWAPRRDLKLQQKISGFPQSSTRKPSNSRRNRQTRDCTIPPLPRMLKPWGDLGECRGCGAENLISNTMSDLISDS
ncbi:hypothetical protein ASPSYDRAFT_45554 [Aspergillus sydowii CBS 593.65]|uniref:Uncharacterized protein n=1 Tax=Aspergillus sydowii CBS 593.65 TaxID=1036612 RepID=A0A1L9TI82_9EURO|nr:uncharacterized protein ASPSYDRAFT_45554 [Aspergillus sydowii CBS 593.65]OJJ59138.1 hypothetical protein ASPSYDRAFT_45554 [Aspergillus sydowii CBS 593.65]